MQKKFTSRDFYNHLLSFLGDTPREADFVEFSEEKLRGIVREEISFYFNKSISFPKTFVSEEQVFLPFAKWKDKAYLEKFYTVFTIEGCLQNNPIGFSQPNFISSETKALKLVWLRSSIELVYTFEKLIYQYSAIPLPHNLHQLIAQSFFICKKQSKKLKSPNPESLETFHSRIRKYKPVYTDIDDALRVVFEKKVD